MAYAFNDNKTKFQIPDRGSGNWVDAVYPIGSVYLSVAVGGQSYSAPEPADLFGGTWERIEGLHYLMSADSASGSPYRAGQKGGERKIDYTPAGTVAGHKLTVNEMPSHNHVHYGISGTTEFYAARETGDTHYIGNIREEWNQQTRYTGGSQSHNHGFNGTPAQFTIEPQFFTVNVWVRTA